MAALALPSSPARSAKPASLETTHRRRPSPPPAKLLHAGRIWIDPAEIDDTPGWEDESSPAEQAAGHSNSNLEAEQSQERAAEEPDFVDHPEPELVPVSASVFDDDFFRRSTGCGGATHWAEAAEPPTDASLQPIQPLAPEPTRLFAGVAATHAQPAESDELDIPAFLRRSR
jgi:hypothetical protein